MLCMSLVCTSYAISGADARCCASVCTLLRLIMHGITPLDARCFAVPGTISLEKSRLGEGTTFTGATSAT
eukprot:2249577-Rhodomonas_salina.2